MATASISEKAREAEKEALKSGASNLSRRLLSGKAGGAPEGGDTWNWPAVGVARAYAVCLQQARSHYENFPTASRLLLGKDLAGPVAAIYAFSRTADDYADEPDQGTAAQRLQKIDAWEARLDRALRQNEPDHPVFVALADCVHRYRLPEKLLRDLLSAFRQDVQKSRYETPEEMLDYCTRSADPVGRLVLRLHGYDDPRLDEMSDAICTALQLINFWQDVWVDLEKDRIYLPRSEMRRFGVTEEQLCDGTVDERYRALLQSETARLKALFQKGAPLADAVQGRLALWLKCVWWGGMRIVEKLERAGYDAYRHRPALSGADKLVVLYRALAKWPPAGRRAIGTSA